MTNLILVPGLMCDRTVWEPQMHALSDIAQCCVPDHGSADSLSAMASSILRDAPKKFAIAGHSMGGRVAFEVYRQAPERVEKLAIFDTKYQPLPPGEAGEQETAGRYKLLAIAREQGVRVMATEWVKGMVHPDRLKDPVLIPAILNMFERKSPDIFAGQLNALIHRPDAGPLLPQMHCPTLILCGREDSWSPPSPHEEMAAKIPAARLVIVEKSGHMVTMEQPDAVSTAMRAWLTT